MNISRNGLFTACGLIGFLAIGAFSALVPHHPDIRGPKGHHWYELKKKQFEKVMDEYIAARMGEVNAAGMSIVVVDDDNTVYEKGFGVADKEQDIPVQAKTLFHVGSITKVFTGIAIMQLAQEGLIDIDAPIQTYLPDFSIKYHENTRRMITIRSIMAHQSGIFGDKVSTEDGSQYPVEDFRTFPEFSQNEYAPYNPNYITAYSNFAVSLLGLIVERVSGKKYEEYVYDHILKPCGMNESGFDPVKENPTLLAKGYDAEGNPFPYYYINCGPAGFLASSSDNMAKFIKMIVNNGFAQKRSILHPATLQYMYHNQSVYLPMNLYDRYASAYTFGLSWMLENHTLDYLGKVVGHGGNLPPYNSNLLIAKDKKLGVFVTANSANFYPNDISYYALEQAAKIFRNLRKPELPDVPPVVSMPKHIKHFYTGTYCMMYESPIEVYEENDTLFAQFLHAPRFPLVYHADDWVSLNIDGSIVPGIRFAVRNVNGKKVLCAENRGQFTINRQVAGNHLVLDDTLPDAVTEKFGIYIETTSQMPAVNLYADTIQRSKKPFIRADNLADNTVFSLLPSSDGSFVIQGLGRGAQETVYSTGDTLHYAGYKLVKMPPAPVMRAARSAQFTETEEQAVPAKTQKMVVDELIKNIKKSQQM
ncbi:MAG: serine hydrolase [Fibrobacter sp.]|nr:serine hydrolase [Fibrobacter sp.]